MHKWTVPLAVNMWCGGERVPRIGISVTVISVTNEGENAMHKTKSRSKNKLVKKPLRKKTPKAKINPLEKRVSELDRLVPFRTCYVCERESRDLMLIPPLKFRHEDCNPGSSNWVDYWERKTKKEKALEPDSRFLYEHAVAKGVA